MRDSRQLRGEGPGPRSEGGDLSLRAEPLGRTMFQRVLVATRGEIAARITRSVQAVGAEAVVAAANDGVSSCVHVFLP